MVETEAETRSSRAAGGRRARSSTCTGPLVTSGAIALHMVVMVEPRTTAGWDPDTSVRS